ncbi:MAG: hypothetical protein AVDCRST_MAG38-1278, partial [uncultured Solirubrobacteraceae bacterium]
AVHHLEVAVRAARPRGARPLGRGRARPAGRAGPAPRSPAAVPRAALRRPAARRHPEVPARGQGRLLVRPRALDGHGARSRRAARRRRRSGCRVGLRRSGGRGPGGALQHHDRRRRGAREPGGGRVDVLHL